MGLGVEKWKQAINKLFPLDRAIEIRGVIAIGTDKGGDRF